TNLATAACTEVNRKHPPAFGRRLLHLLQRCARLYLHHAFDDVAVLDAVHALHVDDHVAFRRDGATGNTGQATLHGDVALLIAAAAHDVRDLVYRGWAVHLGRAPDCKAAPVLEEALVDHTARRKQIECVHTVDTFAGVAVDEPIVCATSGPP